MGGNNNQNLKPFTKNDNRASEAGKSSKRKPFDIKIRELLEEEMKSGKDLNEVYFKVLSRIAIKEGSNSEKIMAIRDIWNRAYGNAKSSVDISGQLQSQEIEVTQEEKARILKEFMDNR